MHIITNHDVLFSTTAVTRLQNRTDGAASTASTRHARNRFGKNASPAGPASRQSRPAASASRQCSRPSAAGTRSARATAGADAPVGGTARGRLRLVSYLQPLDPLYFAAGGKSVSISDYSLELRRL